MIRFFIFDENLLFTTIVNNNSLNVADNEFYFLVSACNWFNYIVLVKNLLLVALDLKILRGISVLYKEKLSLQDDLGQLLLIKKQTKTKVIFRTGVLLKFLKMRFINKLPNLKLNACVKT